MRRIDHASSGRARAGTGARLGGSVSRRPPWLLPIFASLLLVAATAPLAVAAAPDEPLPWANPWDVGMDYEHVNAAFAGLAAAVKAQAAPGVVGMVVKDGKIVARRAIGANQTRVIHRPSDTGEIAYVPVRPPMSERQVFDVASLTKMVATTTAMMILVEEGRISLDEKVTAYLPSFGARAKGEVTVRHLLTHSSGLPSGVPFHTWCIDRDEIYRSIDEDVSLESPPGKKRVYSDVGYMMAGRLVETVSGRRLDRFAQERIFGPLGMRDTGFLPRLADRPRVAPTEYDPFRNGALQGIVHDENARSMGGVSGHAGLFSTADDLARFAQMILNRGELGGVRILKPETVDLMLTPQLDQAALDAGSEFLRNRRQLLGWWGMDAEATVGDLGGLPSATAFGHTGFTGTVLMIDPEHKAAAILLSNAVHPRREEADKTALRRAFFIGISKALVGEKKVNLQKEPKERK